MKPCPQCTSMYCGEWSCRFSGLTHSAFRATQALIEENRENAYADAMKSRSITDILAHAEYDIFGRPLKEGQ